MSNNINPGNLKTTPLQSRIHRLNDQPFESVELFLKREDELSFGVSGTKLRKYRSLIPRLKQENIHTLVALGGKNSNNVIGLAQLATESQVNVHFVLKGSPSDETPGTNFQLLNKIWPNLPITWVDPKEWGQALNVAENVALKLGEGTLVLPEGAFHPWSLPGAMELADDIYRNCQAEKLNFDSIFIDSGTGCSAIGLLIRLHQLGYSGKIFVVQLAESIAYFRLAFKKSWEFFYGPNSSFNSFNLNFEVVQPSNGKSFGSINRSTLDFIKDFAQKEGVLLDPIYSGKTILTARITIEKYQLKGKALLIHSGGALALPGFLNRF